MKLYVNKAGSKTSMEMSWRNTQPHTISALPLYPPEVIPQKCKLCSQSEAKAPLPKPSLGQLSARATKDLKLHPWPLCRSEGSSFGWAFHTVELKNAFHNPIYFFTIMSD